MNIKHHLSLLLAAALVFASPLAAAAIISYTAALTGAAENPANASPGTGTAFVTFDTSAHTLHIQAVFAGLLGTTTAAHIHCCVDAPGNVGVAVSPGTLPGFPRGVTSGSYDQTLDLTLAATYTAAFVTNFGGGTLAGAEAALFAGLNAGRAYFNIHTPSFPGGEIRGFLQVPEPQSLWLAGVALLALAWVQRRRRV